MTSSAEFLNPSDAARRLGVSTKALRLYEQRGLVAPLRTAAGWRTYGPTEMARAAEIVALRALGLSLAQVARVLGGDPQCLEPALAAHQATLEGRARELAETITKLRSLRAKLVGGQAPASRELAEMLRPPAEKGVAFDLPWPWGGEKFELPEIRKLTFITGPLGSGKTRFARMIAETLPQAAFLDLDRATGVGAETDARIDRDPALRSRVDHALAWLVEDGATESSALASLLVALESGSPAILVIDLIEQGLDQASQEALVGYLRHRAGRARPLFLLTRSTAILDLTAVGPGEAVIFCPANHSPPILVAPYPGAPGYEAVASCLAPPAVRARTEGVIAWRPRSGAGLI